MQLTLMLQCHGDYEIEMLQPQSHRGRETTPAKSENPPRFCSESADPRATLPVKIQDAVPFYISET